MDKITAMNLLKNTFVDYTLIDGTTVKMTLAFALLKAIEGKKPELADRYYRVTSKKQSEVRETDMLTIMYTAYMCANIDDPDLMDEDVFEILVGYDRTSMSAVVEQLMGVKKKQAFPPRS